MLTEIFVAVRAAWLRIVLLRAHLSRPARRGPCLPALHAWMKSTPVPAVRALAARVRARLHASRERVQASWARLPVQMRDHGQRALQGVIPLLVLVALVLSMGGTWHFASAAPRTIAEEVAAGSAARAETEPAPARKKSGRELTGKLNLNTASEEQLMRLPTVGPSKAERIVTWRKKNGGFKRTADLRRVKGFGYKSFKRLEPYLDIKGETTLD